MVFCASQTIPYRGPKQPPRPSWKRASWRTVCDRVLVLLQSSCGIWNRRGDWYGFIYCRQGKTRRDKTGSGPRVWQRGQTDISGASMTLRSRGDWRRRGGLSLPSTARPRPRIATLSQRFTPLRIYPEPHGEGGVRRPQRFPWRSQNEQTPRREPSPKRVGLRVSEQREEQMESPNAGTGLARVWT